MKASTRLYRPFQNQASYVLDSGNISFSGNSDTLPADTNVFLLAAIDSTPIRVGADGDILTQDTVEAIAEELIVAQVDEMMACL